MTKKDFLEYNFIKEKYDGILEIYPTKATNYMVFNKVLKELQKDYNLIQVFDNWIRAFKK